jgi:NhaP-type Na+/H+ or K+/H+ antiporter
VAGGDLPKYPVHETPKPPPNPRANPGLANVFWGAGIQLPTPTREQRRRTHRALWVMAAGLVVVALAASIVGAATSSAGWAAIAAAIAYVCVATVAMVIAVIRDRRRSRTAGSDLE